MLATAATAAAAAITESENHHPPVIEIIVIVSLVIIRCLAVVVQRTSWVAPVGMVTYTFVVFGGPSPCWLSIVWHAVTRRRGGGQDVSMSWVYALIDCSSLCVYHHRRRYIMLTRSSVCDCVLYETRIPKNHLCPLALRHVVACTGGSTCRMGEQYFSICV